MPQVFAASHLMVDLPLRTRNPRPYVLLLTDSLDPSGTGEHMLTLASALGSQARVALLFSDAPAAVPWAARARTSGLTAEILPATALAGRGLGLRIAFARHRPDIAHVHAGIMCEGHGLVAAARRAGVPAVLRTEHLPCVVRDAPRRVMYALGVQSVDHGLGVSESARRGFLLSGVNKPQLTVVHNGIAPKLPARSREAVRAELGAGDAPLVLTVARFTGQKGHATLLNALPSVLAVRPDARFVWVGSGPLEAYLRARVEALGVRDQVVFLGRRSDVPDLMAAADLFCLPSTFEGHPLVVLEAMAAGLPVIAARAPGITEAVRNGVTGLLVPIGDAPALAAAMIRALGDPALAASLAGAGRTAAHGHFSAERMARETLVIYRAVLAQARHRRKALVGIAK